MSELSNEPQTTPGANLAEHRISLSGGRWGVWRCAGLRGAGFAIDEMARLSFPKLAEAATRLSQARDEHDLAYGAGRTQIEQTLDALRIEQPEDEARRRKALRKALKRLSKRRIDELVEAQLGDAGSGRIHRAEEELAAALTSYGEVFEATILGQAEALRELARDVRLREAVLLQNRHAFHTGLRKIAERQPSNRQRNSQHRQHEALVASYVQRYVLKNDTIGFFGPMGWAHFTDEGVPISVEPAAELVENRRTYYEIWGLEVLAKSFVQDPALRPWLRPRPLIDLSLEGNTASSPMIAPVRLDEVSMALLRSCNGDRPVVEICAEVASEVAGRTSEKKLHRLLDKLAEKGLVSYDFHIPRNPRALYELRQQLERIEDPPVRDRFLAQIDALEAARQQVASAAGDPEALDQAIAEMGEVYERITGGAATRHQGQTYGSRTLFYEDSRRGAEVRLGPEVLERLDAPLDLMLSSGRWYIWKISQSLLEVARRTFRELAGDAQEIGLVEFAKRMTPWVDGKKRGEIGRPIDAELRAKWSRILSGVDWKAPRVTLKSTELRSAIEREFAASGPGWQFGRYHAPDLMIAAASAEAAARGDFELVLGELHIGRNTLNNWGLSVHHPQLEEVFRWIDRDMPGPAIDVINDEGFTDQSRVAVAHVPEGTFLLPLVQRMFALPPRSLLRVSELKIRETESGELRIESAEKGLSLDLLELFAIAAKDRLLNAYSPLGVDGHRPRITIDQLVVWREAWSFEAGDLDWINEKQEADRFRALWHWAHGLGLPQRVFVRVATERKPFFVDFSSPVLVEILVKAVRATRDWKRKNHRVTFTEMHPDFSNLWLEDAAGQRYTSELRLIVVDQRP